MPKIVIFLKINCY